jgi:LPXTG-site transpeptidase (sortase) family protein
VVLRRRSDVRRIAGAALVTAGAALLLAAGGRYALGAVRADRARETWEAERARDVVMSAWTKASDRASTRPVDGSPVARLIIPRISFDEIVLEGVGERELDAAPGHVPGSAIPGRRGNAIVSAHRDRHFKRFDELAVGDTIATESDRSRTTWIVVNRRIIDKDAAALFRSDETFLTLTTCWPIRYLGTAPERLIVTARPLERWSGRTDASAQRASLEW